jgi:tetratricopeptide (TPR) repeat protein
VTAEHYTDEQLLTYMDVVDGREEHAGEIDVETVRKHVELGACSDCLWRLEDLRRFADLLGDPTVHSYIPAAMPRPYSGVSSDRQLVDLLHRSSRRTEEDARAKITFQSLQSLPVERWLLNLPPEARSGGLVRELIAAARAEYDREPRRALRLLDVAEDIARGLLLGDDQVEQLGLIAKTRAEALRMLGKHMAALEKLDLAEGLLGQLPASAYDLAFVDWGRAVVLFSLSRYGEALAVARRAIATFREYGDRDNAERVRMIEATILCEQGDVETAHRMFSRLVIFFGRRDDREMLARLNANLAECEVRLDRRDVAYEYAEDAMRMYGELGFATEQVRVHWILGHALMRAGNAEEAVEELRGAAAAFADLGMSGEEAAVGLDLAELYLSLGEWNEAETLARDLAGRFTVAGAPVHRARAFAYLQEAVASRPEAAELVELLKYLRSYLAAADVDDEPVPFHPPGA